MSIDLAEVRRAATRIRDGVEELRQRRKHLMGRLATGVENKAPDKSKDNVKVLLGAVDFPHTGTQTGELVAQKVKSCSDNYQAVEDGLRALSTVMFRMATALESADDLNGVDLNTMVSDLYCVVLVVDGKTPDPIDWFGLGAT